MRIEAYTQVQQLYQSQKVSRTQKTQTASHTAPIKARIQNGTYGVDNASFAEKLLQKQEEMR